MEPRHLLPLLSTPSALPILDVRSAAEFVAGHIPGARHVPFWAVWWRAPAVVRDRNTPVVVYCGHGPRARIAAALLRLRGYRPLCLAGHMSGWQRAGHPVERG
jgi:rhodanese-related sulfurtransferase